MSELAVPFPSLVVLVGAAGSGKSTFARCHFLPTEVVSSDSCRALVSDDERDQSASEEALDLMRVIVEKRLRHNRLSVVDATNVRLEQRAPLLALARRYGRPAFAVVFDLPEDVCLEHNAARSGRSVPERVVRRQLSDLRDSLATLQAEGYTGIIAFGSLEEVAAARVIRG